VEVALAVVMPGHPTMKLDLPQGLATDDAGFIGIVTNSPEVSSLKASSGRSWIGWSEYVGYIISYGVMLQQSQLSCLYAMLSNSIQQFRD
jgi:hypothetical protein